MLLQFSHLNHGVTLYSTEVCLHLLSKAHACLYFISTSLSMVCLFANQVHNSTLVTSIVYTIHITTHITHAHHILFHTIYKYPMRYLQEFFCSTPTKLCLTVCNPMIKEIRSRFLYMCMCVSLCLVVCLMYTNVFAYKLVRSCTIPCVYVSITEGLHTCLYVSACMCVWFVYPYLIYSVYNTCVPGVYHHELSYTQIVCISCLPYFITLLTHTLILPSVYTFLCTYSQFEQQFVSKLSCIKLCIYLHTTICSLCVCLIAYVSIVRTYAHTSSGLIACVIASFICPPEPLTQICITFVLFFLFEVSVFVHRVYIKRRECLDGVGFEPTVYCIRQFSKLIPSTAQTPIPLRK